MTTAIAFSRQNRDFKIQRDRNDFSLMTAWAGIEEKRYDRLLLSLFQDFLADYGMVWVGDDSAADSDYDVLEESPSSDTTTLSHQQAVWNPGKFKFCILPN